jgi:hypothetical protein
MGLVWETSDSSIHDARRLQAYVNMPVLVSVPSILLEPDRRRRKRRLIVEVALALFISLFFITGGLLSYVYVNGMTRAPEDDDLPASDSAVNASQFLGDPANSPQGGLDI